ncbi:MAG: hypothetical protein RM049_06825 [Nostoc sp. DedQUE04]|uniref:hypothetical protein n=1 Tax=Nostoc sp. DedQUE04 TaxID=3075390 RepID=UPI002AD25E2A|nr:hypothetical protein [Nostoc sp. DedQUE04]MDZ8135002.1 hypothetical protein [Nostoc sp. DedQUE04]
MTNNKNLTQPNNQEVILEEINEEELDGVVGGGLIDGLFGRVAGLVADLGASLQNFVG